MNAPNLETLEGYQIFTFRLTWWQRVCNPPLRLIQSTAYALFAVACLASLISEWNIPLLFLLVLISVLLHSITVRPFISLIRDAVNFHGTEHVVRLGPYEVVFTKGEVQQGFSPKELLVHSGLFGVDIYSSPTGQGFMLPGKLLSREMTKRIFCSNGRDQNPIDWLNIRESDAQTIIYKLSRLEQMSAHSHKLRFYIALSCLTCMILLIVVMLLFIIMTFLTSSQIQFHSSFFIATTGFIVVFMLSVMTGLFANQIDAIEILFGKQHTTHLQITSDRIQFGRDKLDISLPRAEVEIVYAKDGSTVIEYRHLYRLVVPKRIVDTNDFIL